MAPTEVDVYSCGAQVLAFVMNVRFRPRLHTEAEFKALKADAVTMAKSVFAPGRSIDTSVRTIAGYRQDNHDKALSYATPGSSPPTMDLTDPIASWLWDQLHRWGDDPHKFKNLITDEIEQAMMGAREAAHGDRLRKLEWERERSDAEWLAFIINVPPRCCSCGCTVMHGEALLWRFDLQRGHKCPDCLEHKRRHKRPICPIRPPGLSDEEEPEAE